MLTKVLAWIGIVAVLAWTFWHHGQALAGGRKAQRGYVYRRRGKRD